jgi:DegV family protein with EDD domain
MIKFILDSASDIDDRIELDISTPISLVPLKVSFGSEVYDAGVSLSINDFYQKLEDFDELPKTSQPSPQAFFNSFSNLLDDKKTELIYFALASGLSGTFQSATIAKSMLSESDQKRVYLIDTGTASAGIHYLLRFAEGLLDKGYETKEIVEKINQEKEHVSATILLSTLENVRKGGRITDFQGKIGELLNIKPLLKIQHGKVETIGKFRGTKRGISRLAEIISDWKENHEELYIIHSFPTKEEVIKLFSDKLFFSSFKKIYITRLGSVIGTHAGKDSIGVITFK